MSKIDEHHLEVSFFIQNSLHVFPTRKREKKASALDARENDFDDDDKNDDDDFDDDFDDDTFVGHPPPPPPQTWRAGLATSPVFGALVVEGK